MDMKREKSSHNALKVDQNVLDSFWVLAESNKKNINETTKSLVNSLLLKQKPNSSQEMDGDLKYSINRLVKGLASSRESARQGYSVALCQILRTFDVITVQDIMDCVEKHLKYTNNMSKSEKGSIFLGKTLVYLSLIKSGLLKKASHKEVKIVVKQLRQMYRKKSYLQQICTSALVLCIQQVDEEAFKESIWPEIESDMKQGWESCTPDSIMLLMTCRKCQSAVVNKTFLKEHWGSSKIICENNYQHLSKIIADSCSCYPVIHLVVDDITREIITKMESPLETFWKQCTSDLFGKHQTREINTGLYVLAQLVPLMKSTDDVKSLFNSSVLSTLMRNLNVKFKATNPLYQGAVNVMNKLTDFIKIPDTDGDIQMAIIRLLWEDQGRHYITKHIDNMIQNLSPEGAKALGEYMIKSFSDGIGHNKSSTEPHEPGKLWDVVSEIRTLVTIPSTITDHQWQSELLQFLVLHSFWRVDKPVSTVRFCDKAIEKLDERLQKKFQDNLLKALHNLLIFKTEKSKVSSLNAYIDTVHSLVHYIKTLLEHREEIVPVPKISKEVLESWNTTSELVNDIHNKIISCQATSGSGDVNLCRAFELLTIFNMLQLFFDASNSITVLQDIQMCYLKAFPIATKGRKSKKSQGEEEPEWIAVITELLLSMMTQGSSLARITAKSVFGYLTSHVTPEALGLITNVFKTEKSDDADDEGQLSFEDDMDEDIDDGNNVSSEEFSNGLNNDIDMSDVDESSDDVDDEDDKDDDESSSSDDDSEGDEDVDEEFRKSVKNALGDAAAEEEEDDDSAEEADDLSDSEMFKFDEALASVFRNLKKTKSKEKYGQLKQIVAFKLRVLDLVETLVKGHATPDLALDLIMPLLELMVHGAKQKEERELGNRATNLFHLLYKRAEVHAKSAVGKDKCLDTVKSILQMSEEAPSKQVVVTVSDGCLLVIRLLLNLEIGNVGPSPVRTRSQRASLADKKDVTEKEKEEVHSQVIDLVRQSLEDFIYKRNHRLNPAFFHNLFSKYPVLFWPVTETLLNSLQDENVKVYCKTQTCSMLSVMINRDSVNHIGEEICRESSAALTDTVSKVIMGMTTDNFKSGLFHEILVLINKYVHLPDNQQMLSKDVLDNLESLHDHFNTDTRRLYRKIVTKLNTDNGQVSEDKKKTKKKRKQKDADKEMKTPKQKKVKV